MSRIKTNQTKHVIYWFEVPALDFNRAKSFYEHLIGAPLVSETMMGTQMGFFPAEDQGISGSICCGEGYLPSASGSIIYLNADAGIGLLLGRVLEAGGQVLLGNTEVTPEIGRIALFLDCEGNRIGLHQPPVMP